MSEIDNEPGSIERSAADEPIGADDSTTRLTGNLMAEVGLRLSPRDFDLISHGLTVLGEGGKRNGDPSAERYCSNLIGRLAEAVHAGEGMSAAQVQAHGRRIEIAMQKAAVGQPGAEDEVVKAMGTMFAAMWRLEADPSYKVGITCAQLVKEGTAQTSKAMMVAGLSALLTLLKSAQSEWAAAEWSASADSIVQWIVDTVACGIDNVKDGHPPWIIEGIH